MKNNGLKYLVIAALLVNAATLLFFWFIPPPHPGRPQKGKGDLISKELDFSKEQQAAFTTLRKQHHRTHDSLLQIISEKRQVLYAQKIATLDSIIHDIGQLQEQIERITYQHFAKVREICTLEQQAKLDKMLAGAVQRVLMPNEGKRPPPKRD